MGEIGYWSEIKLEIIRDYAAAYSRILASWESPRFKHVYIDAFSGSGVHRSRTTGAEVAGSPTSVLAVVPPFEEYHFIDLQQGKVEALERQVQLTAGSFRPEAVHFYNGDCNQVLLADVFPRVRFQDYARALCLLDPYGLQLDWQVIETAGKMRSIEIFLNFPIMDINRNALRRNADRVEPGQKERLTRYWGDESWQQVAYCGDGDLFGYQEKATNEAVVEAFRRRLMSVAGFTYVPQPMPMRNTKGAVVYYLFFASQKPVAQKIVSDIFDKYRDRGR